MISHYESLLALSENMIAQAKCKDWDALALSNKRFSEAVKSVLPTFGSNTSLSISDQRVIKSLLTQLLVNNQTLIALVETKKSRVGHLLGSAKREEKVSKAYHETLPLTRLS